MADYARADMLVDTEWLHAHLADPGVRIVDCDVHEQYVRAHVPSAVSYRGDHYYKNKDDKRFIMPPDQFAEAMASLGISNNTLVVGYDASGGLYGARLMWCLSYYGHHNVKVVNGGWERWLKELRPVTMRVPSFERGTFVPDAPDESRRASAEYIMAAIDNPDVVVLDVRSDAEWEGKNNRGNKRAGKIPGAVHVEWLNNLDPDQPRRLKSADELRAMYEAAGVTPDKEIVTVCQAGIRASQAGMTLRLLGYERVRNYDGSFFDWANRDDTPIV